MATERSLNNIGKAQRDKWSEISGDYVPNTLPCWSEVFRRMAKFDRLSVMAPKRFTGYRVPDPGMIISSEIRRERNIFAWLLSRAANIRRLSNALDSEDGVPVGVSNELWRVYLSTDITESDIREGSNMDSSNLTSFNGRAPAHQRRQAAVAIFGRPPDMFNIKEATWRGHNIPWGTVFLHNPLLVKEIMWDLHQSSFRFDLIALDQYLVPALWTAHKYERSDALCRIFGTSDAFIFDIASLEDTGIAASDAYERGNVYAAFAWLMDAWPNVSECVSSADNQQAPDAVALRYCSTFANTFGRPPVLPKMVPISEAPLGIINYPADINVG